MQKVVKFVETDKFMSIELCLGKFGESLYNAQSAKVTISIQFSTYREQLTLVETSKFVSRRHGQNSSTKSCAMIRRTRKAAERGCAVLDCFATCWHCIGCITASVMSVFG